ncbi:hypothetical protein [Quadrisphaera setariae]|uniref:Uncharacterized protein n=1 Tax=Quadrisphaera setariae TaxID=2593304 RepID=A0A5C8ZLN7_9ACTN|nr:hypothetical protein [Quadrisphaera setariae]TXR58091.1 hypothetical protein FMM08_02495 [Quadrisphaera setariae]
MGSTGLSVVTSGVWDMTSSAPPVRAVGDDADPPTQRAEAYAEEGAWGPATPTRLRGGLIETDDLGCTCQRWHTAKTHGDWDLHQPTPGSFTWPSPSGRVYHRRSTPLLPDLADLLHRD